MLNAERKVKEVSGCTPEDLPDEVLHSEQPLVLKGLVSDWPFVTAARRSADDADAYIRHFYNGTAVTASVGPPEIVGRIFYSDDLKGFNFETRRTHLDVFLDELKKYRDEESPPVHYVGSTAVDYILPGLRNDNDLNLGHFAPSVRIWLGNQTRIAAHYDIPNNIACVVAGKRRFTLFPPEQLPNLYVGPLHHAPAGQAISLVDFHEPDFDKFPKFRHALEHAQVADIAPGDAIFVPSMWWHHVEGLESFNVLINFWWRQCSSFMGTPLDVLNHALLSIRDLPEAQRDAWRDIFEYYVFAPDDDVTAHIPEDQRGALSPIDESTARRLRALLLRQLNQ
ncbi:MAG: cupin-like domain-containing protein [Gammaproteobacteria bacterium]|nr:cupin-like domain-containing protein [Gammaproteobacteria bacterium]MBT8112012.1 cupin-like domain-containing protein [Gammaproteobacteria bacterium]NND47421.1 cupin-like domain-containing protein [Woeseiaceae bacterium]NNL46712.1 cupin-like domain-containing protein [Woeseiaceae bacterium]